MGRDLQPAWLTAAFQRLIYAIVLLAVGVTVIGAIVSPRFRRFLLHQLAPILVLALFMLLFFAFFHPKRAQTSSYTPHPAPVQQPAGTTGQGYTPSAVNPPNWSVILIALGTAAAIVGLGFGVWWRFRRTGAGLEERDVLAELGEEAGAAAARIRRGDSPRDVVIDAYKEMCEILSRRVENPDYLTPREFARRLHARGMRDEHVDRLTRIFEEVRYGHRAGDRFAADAIACLEEIRDAYAQG